MLSGRGEYGGSECLSQDTPPAASYPAAAFPGVGRPVGGAAGGAGGAGGAAAG